LLKTTFRRNRPLNEVAELFEWICQMLHVEVIEATDIMVPSSHATCYPAIRISQSVPCVSRRTRAVDSAEHPTWNQMIHLPVQAGFPILFALVDADPFGVEQDLAVMSLPFGRFLLFGIWETWLTFPALTTRLHVRMQLTPLGHPAFEQPGAVEAPIRPPQIIGGPQLMHHNLWRGTDFLGFEEFDRPPPPPFLFRQQSDGNPGPSGIARPERVTVFARPSRLDEIFSQMAESEYESETDNDVVHIPVMAETQGQPPGPEQPPARPRRQPRPPPRRYPE
jgi:hypothetical protein